MGIKNLDIADKLIVDGSISFVISENCPFSCAFCMRGDRRPNTISEKVIDTVLSQVKIKGRVHLGGGEPLMQSKKVTYLINRIYELGNRPEGIVVLTNSSVCPEKFEEFISSLRFGKRFTLHLIVSNDYYHKQERLRLNKNEDYILERIKEYQRIMINYGINKPIDDYSWMLEKDDDRVAAIGRGKNIKGAISYYRDFDLYRNVNLIGKTICGRFQVQTDGRITPNIDMSWEERDKHYGQEYNILNNPLEKIITMR